MSSTRAFKKQRKLHKISQVGFFSDIVWYADIDIFSIRKKFRKAKLNMKFKMIHNNVNVSNLEKRMAFWVSISLPALTGIGLNCCQKNKDTHASFTNFLSGFPSCFGQVR